MNRILLVEIGVWMIKGKQGKDLNCNISPDWIMNNKKSTLTPHINKLSNNISKSNLPKYVPMNVSYLSKHQLWEMPKSLLLFGVSKFHFWWWGWFPILEKAFLRDLLGPWCHTYKLNIKGSQFSIHWWSVGIHASMWPTPSWLVGALSGL